MSQSLNLKSSSINREGAGSGLMASHEPATGGKSIIKRSKYDSGNNSNQNLSTSSKNSNMLKADEVYGQVTTLSTKYNQRNSPAKMKSRNDHRKDELSNEY